MGSYYEQIIVITTDYLGPAAKRFVDRQIERHLQKQPDDLQRSDIQSLAIRIRSGLLVLTHDEVSVEEAFRRIISVGDLAMEPNSQPSVIS